AAANVVRGQLDALYGDEPKVTTAQTSTDTEQPQQAEQYQNVNSWEQYHSQWQNYYQKYYERYYVGKLHQAITDTEEQAKTPKEKRDEQVVDLRQKILNNAKTSA